MSQDKKSPLHIITGATGSMGKVIATTLALKQKALVLACRNVTKAKKLASELASKTKNNDITVIELNLESFDSVCRFVKELKALDRPIAALINNAGILPRDMKITGDGFEHTIQTNFLSTALLSILTANLIQPQGHIIFTTSVTRKFYSIPEGFPSIDKFSQLGTYGRSKHALTLFAIYLANILKPRHILVECADPGIVDTNMIRLERWFDPIADLAFRPFISKPIRGASSALNALKATESGLLFYHDKSSKTVSELKDKDTFVRLLNNTLRILNPIIKSQKEDK